MINDYDNKFSIEGDEQWITEHIEDDGVSVSGSDTYKPNTNFILNDDKLKIINELKTYGYKTPIYKIAEALKELFKECQSYPYHWAYIAEHYPVRTINRVISLMHKSHGDWKNLENPAAYFTKIIIHRKKKKKFRNTNDTH